MAELISLVRIGRVVAVVRRSLRAPGIVCVLVADAGPSLPVIARREDGHRDHVTALITAAASLQH
ncbi:hypothetical protein [Streptomyces sp. ALI-76-A]|uniref:hypothetical protein n=1 Tax=Streptomyces sp. ALI-76-A TaxID=3025736 RepID=UPI00256F48D3|nr:hypothetical protein [Streptomyces sp. ALI-76-A]MDL5206062.1 hypothetical protein [Streptomyces sp. ALI-76-A]